MSLDDVVLPRLYANGKVLFQQQLDAWRLASQNAFATNNLNLTQLAKDCFLSGYSYDNDGAPNLSSSLQEQINLLSTGGTPISGTSADTFTINTDGFSATISSSGLTDFRTYMFPDASGEIVLKAATQTLTNKTLTAPVIADFTNATHTHLGASTGGALSGNAITSTITGTGNVVKSSSPTISSPTISSPVFSGTSSGTYVLAGSITLGAAASTIFVDGDFLATSDGVPVIGNSSRRFSSLMLTASSVITFQDAVVANKAAISCDGAGSLRLLTGNVVRATVSTLGVNVLSGDLAVPSGNYLYLNGNAGNTSIDQVSSGVMRFQSGGAEFMRSKSTGEILLPDVDPPTANYTNRNGNVKAWIKFSHGGTVDAISASYNISSTSRAGVSSTVNFNTDFANANYVPIAIGGSGADNGTNNYQLIVY
jgi:hypothetical protein